MIPRLAASWYRQSSSPFTGVTTSWSSKYVYKNMFSLPFPVSQQKSSLFHTVTKSYQTVQQQQQRSKIYSCMKINQQQTIAWPAGRRVYTSQIKNTNNKPPASSSSTVTTTTTKTQKNFSLESTTNESLQQRNKTDWAIIKQLLKYIWPKNDIGVKARVVIALSLLVGGKVS